LDCKRALVTEAPVAKRIDTDLLVLGQLLRPFEDEIEDDFFETPLDQFQECGFSKPGHGDD